MLRYRPLVCRIAGRLARGCRGDRDDLIQVGLSGVWLAAGRVAAAERADPGRRPLGLVGSIAPRAMLSMLEPLRRHRRAAGVDPGVLERLAVAPEAERDGLGELL